MLTTRQLSETCPHREGDLNTFLAPSREKVLLLLSLLPFGSCAFAVQSSR